MFSLIVAILGCTFAVTKGAFMQSNATSVIVMVSAGFLILAGDWVKNRREVRAKKREIVREGDKQMAAIWYAMGKVSGRVELGVYCGDNGKDEALNDLELYKIEFLESVMPK
jgi:hypothetical protein